MKIMQLIQSTQIQMLVDDVEDSRIFVQSFRARLWELTDKSLRNRARELISTLRLRGEAFYDRYFYLASYSRFISKIQSTGEFLIDDLI